MAYANFNLNQISQQFSVEIDEKTTLFSTTLPVTPRPEFLAQLDEWVPLALSISTEKARSELIITPVLLEAWRMTGQTIGFFSGINFDVDESEGLVGFCDYILTRHPRQLYVEAPVVMLVEAKNEDMKRGYGQCIAEMIAAQRFNARDNHGDKTIYGVVTTGERWKFLELANNIARIDVDDYYLEHVDKILGILLSATQS
jgi:hypothetical protein